MSGDLISRKAVMKYLQEQKENVTKENEKNKFVPAKVCEGMMIALEAFESFAKQSNNVYDLEKVIQQLEENKEDAIKAIEENSPSEFHMIKIRDLKELFEEYTREQIEIVKSGGIAVGQKGERHETD